MRKKFDRRLFIEGPLAKTNSITLSADQSHYLANVLRAKAGMPVALFNGKDGEWAAEVIEVSKRSVDLRVLEQVKTQSVEPDVWLVFAPIKKARIDFIAQKATELGASHLLPIYTRRTIVDRVKIDRLHANAVEAAEQCERITVPTIGEPVKFEKLMQEWPQNRHIMFCDESLSGQSAHQALSNIKTADKEPWAIFIGPEGGFDENERKLLQNHEKAIAVSLGPRIMRADTAAMAALSLWQSALGDW